MLFVRSNRRYDASNLWCNGATSARNKVDWASLRLLPKHSLMWGIFNQPEAQEQCWQSLDNICTPITVELPTSATRHKLFTDGSCARLKGDHKHEGHAAWAAHLAEDNSADSVCLASGPLPGREQTAYRAEIYAVINALARSSSSDVFTDCSTSIEDS